MRARRQSRDIHRSTPRDWKTAPSRLCLTNAVCKGAIDSVSVRSTVIERIPNPTVHVFLKHGYGEESIDSRMFKFPSSAGRPCSDPELSCHCRLSDRRCWWRHDGSHVKLGNKGADLLVTEGAALPTTPFQIGIARRSKFQADPTA